jgi:hypothetical protein
MPIIYDVDEEGNRVYIKASGQLTNEEILRFENNFLDDARVKPGYCALFDATFATMDVILGETIDELIDLEKNHEEKTVGSKTAFVIIEDEGWKRAKEFERKTLRRAIVFFNLDVAKIWLGWKESNLIQGYK